jgi:hypothetical protein
VTVNTRNPIGPAARCQQQKSDFRCGRSGAARKSRRNNALPRKKIFRPAAGRSSGRTLYELNSDVIVRRRDAAQAGGC